MEKYILYIVFGVLVGILIGYLFSKLYFYQKFRKYGQNSVKKSKSVILGEVSEKIAPLLPEFEYSYKDLIFVGKGIDYVVFDGLSSGNLKQIVFLEVKSGKSNLNNNEKSIKSIIDQKKIKYDIFRI